VSDGFDINSLLQQAQSMQAQLVAAQQEAAFIEVVGNAGNGLVTVTMSAGGEVRGVSISASVVDPGDVSMLEDLVHTAIADALAKGANVQAEAMGPLADLAGPGGGLGGLLG
jgi:DNA-binding YbaB/EbfC family protein